MQPDLDYGLLESRAPAMTVGPENWSRVREVFEGALALSVEARHAYVAATCKGDDALRRQVDLLLDSHERAKSVLETPPSDLAGETVIATHLEGRRIGPYQIAAHIGAGGMGEVYKARDTRLDRTVAIKVLPAHVANDSHARERFEREARAVAALNHPHICTLHDIGRHDASTGSGPAIDYLVMEYLDGETLAARLGRSKDRPLPLDEALRYAVQIASALDKAHRAGIVHRDLKPGNIFLVRGGGTSAPPTAKLLDFGLAKACTPVVAGGPTRVQDVALTTPGTILGTVQYMAPEQVEGKDTDARTDIFAFGAVLFEMMTGRKAFEAENQASLIAAILEREPPLLSDLQPLVPAPLGRIVKICLAKDPDDRWQGAGDLRRELTWVAEGGASQVGASAGQAGSTAAHARSRRKPWLGWAVASGLLVAVVALAILRTAGSREPLRAVRFSILPPEQTTFLGGFSAPFLALSPDGQRLAFVPTPIGGRTLMWIRTLGSVSAQSLAGTDGASFPFWSPDNRMLAFFADGKLKIIDPAGGVPRAICDAPEGRGGAWSRDGVIVFAPQLLGPLYRVPASGGRPVAVTALDASRQEASHRIPSFLPDGRHFLFFAQSGKPDNNIIYVGSIDSNDTRPLNIRASKAVYAAPGYLLFSRDQSLTAQPFDASRLQFSGEAVSLGDQVTRTGYGDSLFSAADNGTLVYWNGGPGLTDLTWFDRKGVPVGAVGERGDYVSLDLSTDEQKVAVELVDPGTGTGDIWVIDLASRLRSRLTLDPAWDYGPLWSPDGARIVFGSIRGGLHSLYQTVAAGGGTDEVLLKSSDGLGVTAWSSDNTLIVYQNLLKYKLGVLPLAGDRTPRLVSQTEFIESEGRLSPNGQWLAYTSNESGTWDVYVRPFPSLDRKWRISPDGGSHPVWRRDGKELFYVDPDLKLMAVPVTVDSSFAVGKPMALFQLRILPLPPMDPRRQYAVAAKGDRFLVNTVVAPPVPSPITVVLNWDAVMQK